MSEIGNSSRRERPLGKWKDKVKEYISERSACKEIARSKKMGKTEALLL